MAYCSIQIINTSCIRLVQLLSLGTSCQELKLSWEATIIESHVSQFSKSAIKISPDGRYIASAQNTFPGFPADIIIWDFETKEIKHRLKLHKVGINSLAFSPDSQLLASQGCLEDK